MSSMNNSEIIMFASIPKPDDLYYVRAEMNETEKQKIKSGSNQQWQILKCRLLIFSEKELIASPAMGNLQQLHIVISKNFYSTGKLQQLLASNNMEGSEPDFVSNEIYETCLHYTLLARISPSWNYVEPYLIRGKNFLTETTVLNAVKLQIIINGNDAHVVIWPQRVKLPRTSLNDLPISQKKSLSENKDDFSYDFSTDNETAYVLPRMSKGKIESVSSKIPLNSPLMSYEDFKRYWKNNYGYRLPETDNETYYYSIRFSEELPLMAYPNLCVRLNNLVLLPHANYETILDSFSSDLKVKLSNVCGKPFGTNSQMGYAVSKLNSSTEIFMYPNWSPNKQVRKIQDDSEAQSLNEESTEGGKGDSSENNYSNRQPVRGLHFTDIRKPASVKLNTVTKQKQNDRQELKATNESTKKYETASSQNNNEKALRTQEYCDSTTSLTDLSKSQTSSSKKSSSELEMVVQNQKTPKLTINQQITLIPTSTNNTSVNLFPPSLPVEFLAPVTINENQLGMKRMGQSVFLTQTQAKKPRSKPHVQEDIDVEEFAKKGLLANANVVTLLHYLRKNSVPCKVKDKKSELINKILTFLNLPTENSQTSN